MSQSKKVKSKTPVHSIEHMSHMNITLKLNPSYCSICYPCLAFKSCLCSTGFPLPLPTTQENTPGTGQPENEPQTSAPQQQVLLALVAEMWRNSEDELVFGVLTCPHVFPWCFSANVIKTIINHPIVHDFTPPIYGDFGDGLLLF